MSIKYAVMILYLKGILKD